MSSYALPFATLTARFATLFANLYPSMLAALSSSARFATLFANLYPYSRQTPLRPPSEHMLPSLATCHLRLLLLVPVKV